MLWGVTNGGMSWEGITAYGKVKGLCVMILFLLLYIFYYICIPNDHHHTLLVPFVCIVPQMWGFTLLTKYQSVQDARPRLKVLSTSTPRYPSQLTQCKYVRIVIGLGKYCVTEHFYKIHVITNDQLNSYIDVNAFH